MMDGASRKRESETPSSQEGNFVAALAHDINGPLDAVRNLLYLLRSDQTLSESGQELLRLADEEAQRIRQFARAAVQQFRSADCPEDANVPALLRSVLEFYASRLESQGISVSARFCDDGDLRVYPGLLRQAFANLLLNAVDAMPKGGAMHARVAAAHEWSGEGREGLRVTFADSGCGIGADDLAKLGRPFFTTKGTAGTGIGLAMVKDTVRKHGGALRVRSNTASGRTGSVFTIFLPAE